MGKRLMPDEDSGLGIGPECKEACGCICRRYAAWQHLQIKYGLQSASTHEHVRRGCLWISVTSMISGMG